MREYLLPLYPLAKVLLPMLAGVLGTIVFVMSPETFVAFCAAR